MYRHLNYLSSPLRRTVFNQITKSKDSSIVTTSSAKLSSSQICNSKIHQTLNRKVGINLEKYLVN